MLSSLRLRGLDSPGFLRVPEITAYFWIAKGLSTALGESTSDYLVHALAPVPAVLLGFLGFVASMILQLRMQRYSAWAYWFAVAMVGVFGTMAADVLHVGFGVPYVISAAFYAVILAGVYATWFRVERTLSVHRINTTRRELFYWAAVVATFALGTAVGDLTAMSLNLGFSLSILLFAALIVVPAAGYRWMGWNPIFCFWFAYVVTRPLGASVADWLGKSSDDGGMGVGSGLVSVILAVLIAGVVAYLARSKVDVQRGPGEEDTVVLRSVGL